MNVNIYAVTYKCGVYCSPVLHISEIHVRPWSDHENWPRKSSELDAIQLTALRSVTPPSALLSLQPDLSLQQLNKVKDQSKRSAFSNYS